MPSEEPMPRRNKRPPSTALTRLSRYIVGNDKYDREDFQKLIKEMRAFRDYREKLADSKAGDLAFDVWQDAFLSLHKVQPEMLDPHRVRPDHYINHRVVEEMHQLPDYKELRIWTAGDAVGSAMAVNLMEPDLETLYDKLEREQRLAQELHELQQALADAMEQERDLDEMLKDWTEDKPPPKKLTDEQEKLRQQIEEMQQDANAKQETLEELLQQASPEIRDALRQGLQAAADQAEGMSTMSEAWGLDPGELTRLPAGERMELAKRFNNDKFRRIAELFGPMKRYAFTEQRRKVNYAHEEIFDVELGNDIARLLPLELMELVDEDLELLFLDKYMKNHLLQYAMRGKEKVGKGGILYIYDGSGSMSGDKEVWSKALGLTLLHIARKQKREFVAIQFGSVREIMIHDFRDGDLSPDRVLDFAEFFFAGGTNFEQPLNVGLQMLQDEFTRTGALKSDIVFVSDGECGVSEAWSKRWESERARLNFRCWGVNLDNTPTVGPMYDICAGQVATIKSLVNGEGVGHIFGNL